MGLWHALRGLLLGPALLVASLALSSPAQAAASAGGGETLDQSLCRLIEDAAAAQNIPPAFLTRLIWRESSFRPGVTSPAGAQGIAQFMPGTASEQGLVDPFDPQQAIPASASFLAALKARFGNWGLAAGAYNGGPNRIGRWLQHGGSLPAETEDYVQFVTGHPIEDWAAALGPRSPIAATDQAAGAPSGKPCLALVTAIRATAPSRYKGPYAPFGVQLSGNFSKARALASYRRVATRFAAILGDRPTLILGSRMAGRGRRAFYRVRLPEPTLGAARALCTRLQQAGGACVVLRN